MIALRLIGWALGMCFLFEVVDELSKCSLVFRWTLSVSIVKLDI